MTPSLDSGSLSPKLKDLAGFTIKAHVEHKHFFEVIDLSNSQ